MSVNWQVRFNNPVFLVQILLAVFSPMLAYYGLNFKDLSTWGILKTMFFDSLKNPYVLFLIAINIFNTINDPTTKGLSDSARAMTYIKPN